MKRKLKEITSLSKVEEVSVCHKNNPPANGLLQFDIIKNSINKSGFEELFEALQMPEYMDFTSYLAQWLEDDVNFVAYQAFLDALFMSLQDICYNQEISKEDKLVKFRETFDSFIKEYENSVITKSEDGKILINMNKQESVKDIELENKQEKKMSFNIIESLKSLINKAEEAEVIEQEVAEEPVAEIEAEVKEEIEEVVSEVPEVEEAKEEIKEEVVEKTVEGEEIPEEQPAPEEAEITEPEVVEAGEEIEQPEVEAEIEEAPAVEAEVQEEVEAQEPVEKSTNVEELISKATEDLQAKIEMLEKASKENEIKLEKAELTKSVESEFSGLVGKTEDIVEVIYELNKSSLSLESKEFVLEGLKTLSAKNIELTKAIGVNADEVIEKSEAEILESKAQKIMSENPELTENQAFLFARGEVSLTKALETSRKVKK